MKELRVIPVEYDLRPAFYDDFQCLAGDCRLTCCKGWHITFDKKDFMFLKRQTGSPDFNARMSHALRRIRSGRLSERFFGEIQLKKDGLCPLQCENGLCILQLEKGHMALPLVCRTFPRMEAPLPSVYLERTLSPACEGVLALLWDLPDGIDFRSDPLPPSQRRKASLGPQGSLNAHFQEIRSQCIDFLQDRRISLPQRILLMGVALKNLVDGERDLSRWMTRVQFYSEQAAAGQISLGEEHEQSLHKFLANNLRLLPMLPQAEDDFKTVPQEMLEALVIDGRLENGVSRATVSSLLYRDARDRFQEQFGSREYFMENLMVALFFQLHFPVLDSPEELWKSYVSFCSLYSVFRFLAVMSCRAAAAGDQDELFRLLVYASRTLIHNGQVQDAVRDMMFETDSSSLAHISILLGG